MTLRLASFGMRGFIGESLDIRSVMNFAAAYGTFLDGGRVLLARDTRYSSPMLHAAVSASLISCGCEVVDLGICPTPVLQFSVKPLQAAGGVSITGGHNAMGWNSLSLIGSDGAFLEPAGGETVLDIYHAGDFLRKRSDAIGMLHEQHDFAAAYFEALRHQVDVAAIARAKLNVVIDSLGGAGCPYLVDFAATGGFNLIAVNDQPSGYLPREAEPRPRSALQMASFIRHVKGQAGFVLSSDMARMSMVTETGEPVSEEYTFAVIADFLLQRQSGLVVTNSCTSRMIDDIAARHGSRVVKTPVGQAYIMSALADESGLVGGEGSGSVILPAFSRGSDGFLMMALVLESMAAQNKTLSTLIRDLPRYHIVKKSVACESRAGYRAIETIKNELEKFEPGAVVDVTDGLRLDWSSGWVHARASHTEQIVRVISEDRERDVAEQRADHMVRQIGALV
jgi:phosphomannomutase